jgi:hypothetical protein
METKLGKIEKFIDEMNIEEINESAQALLLTGDDSFGGSNDGCTNSTDCTSGSNKNCQNTGSC